MHAFMGEFGKDGKLKRGMLALVFCCLFNCVVGHYLVMASSKDWVSVMGMLHPHKVGVIVTGTL